MLDLLKEDLCQLETALVSEDGTLVRSIDPQVLGIAVGLQMAYTIIESKCELGRQESIKHDRS